MATGETALITADQYLHMPDNGQPTELIRGRVVPMNVATPRHGEVCGQTLFLLKTFLVSDDIGRVVCNDSGVVTEHDPDTVRGGDVSFYSYERVPKGPLPSGYLPVPPDAVFEVRSAYDRWAKVVAKVGEYLNAGVTAVCVLDPPTQTIHVYHADQPVQIFTADDEFSLPHILGNFRVKVRRFFE